MRRCIRSICSFGVLLGVAALAGRAAGIDPTPIPVHPIDGNLVENPHFDEGVGLSGWTASPSDPPDVIQLCSTCDFEDQLGSNGVILLVNGFGPRELETCVAVRPGASYDIGVWTIVPSISVPGFAGVSVAFMTDRFCTSPPQETSSSGVFSTDPISWQWYRTKETFVMPAGTRSVRLGLRLAKNEGEGPFKASFDEPFVIPEPGANAAALGAWTALLASRRRRSQASRAAG